MITYETKILEILKDKELTLSQIANQNNLNYQSTKRALELLTQLDLIEMRLIKNKTLYSEKLKEPRYFFILEQMLRGMELDEFGYVIVKMKQIIIEKEIKKELNENPNS